MVIIFIFFNILHAAAFSFGLIKDVNKNNYEKK